jgi:hypothetical protein
VFDRVLRRMRELVRTSRYVMTVHGHEEMESDQLGVFDVERCLLTGQIVERQRDHGTGEWKYLVEGEVLSGDRAVVVAKVGATKRLVIITVYLL